MDTVPVSVAGREPSRVRWCRVLVHMHEREHFGVWIIVQEYSRSRRRVETIPDRDTPMEKVADAFSLRHDMATHAPCVLATNIPPFLRR